MFQRLERQLTSDFQSGYMLYPLQVLELKICFTRSPVFIVQIPELSNPSVLMRDPQKVQEILQCMLNAGYNTLQVLNLPVWYFRTHRGFH